MITTFRHLPVGDQAQEVERHVEAFELAWREGVLPRLQNFLPKDPAIRLAVLVELIHTDIEYRWRHGCPLSPDEYGGQFPELAGESALAEFTATDEECRRIWAGLLMPSSGETTSRFAPMGLLGTGTFGDVHKVWDSELQRVVAVKIPRKDGPGSIGLDRFLEEARSVARLRHPHIVSLHEARRADGRCLLIMEYIEGETLAERLAHGLPSPRQAVIWSSQLAGALSYAHSQGVIHRDIKPANILLDTKNQPYLTDFGLAHRDGEETGPPAGWLVGTPAYAPPEQVSAPASRLDGRADIYSLGMVLIELLTGSTMQTANHSAADRLRQCNPAIPRDLAAICLKAVQVAPEHRYATAAAFAEDLRRFLEGRTVAARPCGVFGSVWRWSRRSPALTGLGVALLVVTIAGLGAVLVEWRRAELNLRSLRHRERQLSIGLERTRLTFGRLIENAGMSSLTQGLAVEPHQEGILRIAVEFYEDLVHQFDGDSEMKAELGKAYHKLAQLRIALQQEGVPELLDKCIAIQEELIRENPRDWEQHNRLGSIFRSYGFYWKHRQELVGSAKAFELAIESWRRALAHSTPEENLHAKLVRYGSEIGYLRRDAGLLEESLEAWLEVIRVCETTSEELLAGIHARGQHAIAYFQAGVLQARLGRFDEAWAAQSRAAEMFQTLCDEDPQSERFQRFRKYNRNRLDDLHRARVPLPPG